MPETTVLVHIIVFYKNKNMKKEKKYILGPKWRELCQWKKKKRMSIRGDKKKV